MRGVGGARKNLLPHNDQNGSNHYSTYWKSRILNTRINCFRVNASTSNAPKIWILSRLMDEIYKSCRHHIILIHALISILIKCKQRRRRWCWWWWYLCFSLFKYKYRVVNVAAIEGKNEMEMNGDSQFKFDSSPSGMQSKFMTYCVRCTFSCVAFSNYDIYILRYDGFESLSQWTWNGMLSYFVMSFGRYHSCWRHQRRRHRHF